MRHLEKNVFVTGACRGFGRATALGFAREGASVIYLVDRLPDELESVSDEIMALGSKPISINSDLGTIAGCDAAVEAALASGSIDIAVINHAYTSTRTAFVDLEDGEWQRELDVNLTSYFALAQRIVQSM